MWCPTSEMLADEMTKDMEDTETWEVFYSTGSWCPRHQPLLPEDLVTYENGKVTRWRIDATTPTAF